MNTAFDGNVSERPRDTVLLVISEVLTRNLLADYVRKCGYHVFEAKDFDEAFIVLGKFFDVVDVVLGDAISGVKISQWAHKHRPQLRIVVADSVEQAADEAAALCDQGPLKTRPYDPQMLVDVIRRAMATREG
jgi:DNA-binding NtrC family response regulator